MPALFYVMMDISVMIKGVLIDGVVPIDYTQSVRRLPVVGKIFQGDRIPRKLKKKLKREGFSRV
jgi:hypothetical protein